MGRPLFGLTTEVDERKPMRTAIVEMLGRFARFVHPKSAPSVLTGNQWSGTSFIDSFKRERNPTPNELMAELKNTAFTCATINAAVCAAFPPKLYVATDPRTQPQARSLRK